MKFLIILVLIFLAYKALMRNVRVSVFKNYHPANPDQKIKPEGQVTIENIKKPGENQKKDNDDYVDFEEIK